MRHIPLKVRPLMRRLLTFSLGSVLLAGCATSVALLNNPTANPLRSQSVQPFSPERQVSKENIQKLAAVLTGEQAMPEGQTIPERGSTQGRELTRQYIFKTLESMGYQPELRPYRSSGTNVLAELKADQPTDEYILLGAHMDSVRNAGADDNSSGTVAVLEAARILKNLPERKVNLIFAWFDEEELGLIGSRALAKEYRAKGLNISSVHTLDMVGYDSDGDSAIEIEQPDGPLWDYYQMVNTKHDLNLTLYRTSSGSTDHVAFRQQGFVSVGLCEEWVNGDTTPNYHRKGDRFDTVNFDYLTNVTRLTVAAVGDLARKVPEPLIQTRMSHEHFPARERLSHSSYEGLPLD